MNFIKRFFQWLVGLFLGKRRRQEYGGGDNPFPDTGTGNPLGLTANIKLVASIGDPTDPDPLDNSYEFDVTINNPSTSTAATITNFDVEQLTPDSGSPTVESGIPCNESESTSVAARRSGDFDAGPITFALAIGESDGYTIPSGKGTIAYTYSGGSGSIDLSGMAVSVDTSVAASSK